MNGMNDSLFAIPVHYGSLGKKVYDLNRTLINDIDYEILSVTELRSGVGVKQTKLHLEKKYDSFLTLSHHLKNSLLEFVRWSGVQADDIKVCELWGNFNNDPNAFHMPHSHSVKNALFTGVYYPTSGFFENDVQQESDYGIDVISSTQPRPGDLVLLDPYENIKTAIVPEKCNKYPFFGNPICFSPKESAFICFPSYVSHMTSPTKKENYKRYSVAFNVTI